jgi:hypothetical protein
MRSATLQERVNERYLGEALKVRAKLVARLRRLDKIAERAGAGSALAAFYRLRLSEIDGSLAWFDPPTQAGTGWSEDVASRKVPCSTGWAPIVAHGQLLPNRPHALRSRQLRKR